MTKQFLISEFNPDAMSEGEIREWLDFIGQGQRPQVANQWFPGVKGRYRLAKDVRNYLWNKLTAMGLRLKGNIVEAQRYEVICDRIYQGFIGTSVEW